MYCPSCGSNNKDEVKFCTRCGTNLNLVSDALRGRTTGALETDERMVTLLKDYYRGRRMMLIGGAASALSLFKLAGPFLLGFPEKLIPIVILSLVFLLLSLIAFVWGLVKWNNSSSEIKALGGSPSKAKKVKTVPEPLLLAADPTSIGGTATNPTASPSSVTEYTTHLLDENDQAPTALRKLTESHRSGSVD